MPQIEFTFEIGKPVEVKPIGFKGPACKAATLPYEQLLGKTVSTVETPEMRAPAVIPLRVQQKG